MSKNNDSQRLYDLMVNGAGKEVVDRMIDSQWDGDDREMLIRILSVCDQIFQCTGIDTPQKFGRLQDEVVPRGLLNNLWNLTHDMIVAVGNVTTE